jgi:hypothetical protein
VPLVDVLLKPFAEELAMQAPAGTEVTDSTGKSRLRKGEDFDFEVNWTDNDSALENFKGIYANTAIYSIKSVLAESPDTLAYEVVKKFPKPEKTACVFIVTKTIGENRYYCQSVTFGGYHENDEVFNVSAIKLMVRCAQSLKLK